MIVYKDVFVYILKGSDFMALLKCPECGKEVSSKTDKCLSCGYKINIQKEKNKYTSFICNNYYFFIVILVLVTTILVVNIINNKLNESEQKLYNIIEENKNTFKNPQSLIIVSAKICNDDYSIIRITANNSFGAETTDTYYVNKNVITMDETIAKAVSKKCFEEELNNYESVSVLSDKSISKVNKLVMGE